MRQLVEVAEGVLVATSDRFVTTSTVVAGRDGQCLLVDPAVTADDLGGLAEAIAGRGLHVVAGWSTHPHWDHVLWSRSLGDVRRWATVRGAEVAATEQAGLVEEAEASAPGHDRGLLGQLTGVASGNAAFPWNGPAIRIIEHDGHAPGHGALFVEDVGVLIGGDMCSDVEIPLLDLDSADPIGGYGSGVELLSSTGATLIVPGHGSVCGCAEMRRRFDLDRRYLGDLQAGGQSEDPRLGSAPAWLLEEHAKQVAWARDPS